jgi:branched-chain amino acid transport system permease protein
MNRRALDLASSYQGLIALVVLLVVLWFAPAALSASGLSILVLALFYAIGGMSFNFLYGSLGIFSLAQPVFIAAGGYTSIFLWNRFGVSPWLSLLIAPVVAAILALPVALVATRIGGGAVLTALVTLIVAEAVTPILIAIPALGGAIGLYAKPPPVITFGDMQFSSGLVYVRILAVLNVLFIAFWMWWKRSRFGLFTAAIKDSPEAAQAVGIANARIRLSVFLIAAMLAAPAGVIFAQYNLLTSADIFLGGTALFQIITIALVGGAARPWGSLAGALLIVYLAQEVSDRTGGNPAAQPVTFAAVFVVMVLIVPRGLSGTWAQVAARRRPERSRALGAIGGTATNGSARVDVGGTANVASPPQPDARDLASPPQPDARDLASPPQPDAPDLAGQTRPIEPSGGGRGGGRQQQ